MKLPYATVDEFVRNYAVNVSPGSLFITTKPTVSAGARVQFVLTLSNGSTALKGGGTVHSTRTNAAEGPVGFTVDVESLDPASESVMGQLLAAAPADSSSVDEVPAIAPVEVGAPSFDLGAMLSDMAASAPPEPEPPPSFTFDEPPPPEPEPDAQPAAEPEQLADPPPDEAPSDAPAFSFEAPGESPTADAPSEVSATGLDADFGAPAEPPEPAPPPPSEPEDLVFEMPGEGETLSLSRPAHDEAPASPPPPAPAFEFDAPPEPAPESSDALGSMSFDAPPSEETPAEEAPPPPDEGFAFEPPPSDDASADAVEETSEVVEEVVSEEDEAPPPSAPPRYVPSEDPEDSSLPQIRRRNEDPREPRPSAPPPRLAAVAARPVSMEELVARSAGKLVFLNPPEHIEKTGPIIGIDLGTSNSAVALLNKGKPQILHSKDGYNTIPSVVALGKNNNVLVGHRARSHMLLNPSQSIYGAKRLVGRDFESVTVREVRHRFHYEILPGRDGKDAVTMGNHLLTLEEVQGIILRECKQIAEQHLNAPVSRAVVTCPAYYSEQQREAVRRAGAMSGLVVERVLNEPTAAALAYGLNRELSRKVLVYDLGGGTFDATLLRIEKNTFEVLATGGDIFLGGLDFDNQIVDLLLKKFQIQHRQVFSGDAVGLSRVAEQAEKAKVALSERSTFDVHLPMLQMSEAGQPMDLQCTVSREEVNQACQPLVVRTFDVVRDVLLDAKLKATEVDDVILVGGMSRMPLVREHVKELFKKQPLASVNADEAVALGAALYSGIVESATNVVLIDVVPMTVGIGIPGGGYKRLIERNTPLPAGRSFGLTTSRDDETSLELQLFQGEDSDLSNNDYLGTARIEGLPKGPKGSVQVAVTVRLDAECVIHVDAKDMIARQPFKTLLANRYTPDEIRARLRMPPPSQPSIVQQARAKELEDRGGQFWKLVKRVVGKKDSAAKK
ncbi:MAG: Hsp70 family protein [Archangium sp.]|nr:Hsp70 family protein [Archangium sp.]